MAAFHQSIPAALCCSLHPLAQALSPNPEQLSALAALLLLPSFEGSAASSCRGFVAAFLAAVCMHGPFSSEEFIHALLQSPGSLGAIIQLLESGQRSPSSMQQQQQQQSSQDASQGDVRKGGNDDDDNVEGSPVPRFRRPLSVMVWRQRMN